jgi:hypothetical protein
MDTQINEELHRYMDAELDEAFVHDDMIADSRYELHDIYSSRISYSFTNIHPVRQKDA